MWLLYVVVAVAVAVGVVAVCGSGYSGGDVDSDEWFRHDHDC